MTDYYVSSANGKELRAEVYRNGEHVGNFIDPWPYAIAWGEKNGVPVYIIENTPK